MLEFGQADRKGQIKTLKGLRAHLVKLEDEVRKFSSLIKQLESVLDLPLKTIERENGASSSSTRAIASDQDEVSRRLISTDYLRGKSSGVDGSSAKRSDYIDIEADLIRLLSVSPMSSLRDMALALMSNNKSLKVGKSTVHNRLKSSPRFALKGKYWTVVENDVSL